MEHVLWSDDEIHGARTGRARGSRFIRYRVEGEPRMVIEVAGFAGDACGDHRSREAVLKRSAGNRSPEHLELLKTAKIQTH